MLLPTATIARLAPTYLDERRRYDLGETTESGLDWAKARVSGHQDVAPRAALNLGRLLEGRGDPAGTAAAYQLAIDSGHQDFAAAAAVRARLQAFD